MATKPDPIAAKSGFLRMYMSNHPDTLVSYAKWYGKVTETITSAEMTSIDSQKMTLKCTFKAGSTREVVIPFEPPLVRYDELKPRMIGMGAIAQEELGMAKAPEIKSFRLPLGVLTSGAVTALMAYLAFPPADEVVTSPMFIPSQLVNSLFGSKPFLYAFYSILAAHVLESAYTYTLCRRHQTGFFVGAAYVVTTFIFGFPIWKDFKSRVQALRIESIMKSH